MVERADRDTDVVGVLARAEANEAVHQEPLARRQALPLLGCRHVKTPDAMLAVPCWYPGSLSAFRPGSRVMAPKIAPP
jgi:hypothetical protein